MSKLTELLLSLNNEEKESLNALSFSGKEKQLFDILLNSTPIDLQNYTELYHQLEVTETFYYKINSVILSKIYHHFSGNEKALLLQFLLSKGLYQHLKTEIKAILSSHENLDSLIYLKAFHISIDIPFKYYEEELAIDAGNKYLKSLQNVTDADVNYIDMHLYFSVLNKNAASKNAFNQLDVLSLLNEKRINIEQKGYYLAEYYLYRSYVSYYIYYAQTPEMALPYLDKCIKLIPRIQYFFPVNLQVFLDLLVADISLKSNKIKESKCLYDKYLGVNTDTQLYGYYSHFELYGIVSILSNDYSQVSKILQQVFNPAITRNFEINALRGVLLHAKFSLATHSYDDALSWILEGFTSNQKSHYAPFDMQLRVLEVLCFIGKEDFEQAYKLSLRNQKYIYNKGNTEILDFYDRLFKLFMKILRKINSKKKIGSVEISTLKKLNSENIDLYAGLFSILQDKISLHNNKLNLHRF